MKKVILLFCFIILVVSQSNSQSFIFNRVSPKTITVDTAFHNVIIFNFVLKNTSSTQQNFKLVKALKILPTGWEASICCKLGCIASFIDTVPPFGYPDKYTLGAGETDSTVTIDISALPQTTGTAKIVLRAFMESNPAVYQQDTCIAVVVNSVGISQISTIVSDYELKQNYPNPFNPTTTINFSLPKNSEVNLVVYDMQGREVARLLNNVQFSQGSYKYDFNADDFRLSSGVYLYKLITNDFTSTKKMLLIK